MTATALARFEAGLEAQRAGRPDAAISAYREALATDPAIAPAHYNLGHLLRERGDMAGAALAFDAAVRLRPTAADAWLNLGLCRETLGDLDTALKCYREAALHDGRLAPTAWFNEGNVLRKMGDLDGAAGAFRRAGDASPDTAEVWLNLGNCLREIGQLPAATDALSRALDARPDWPEARWNLALSQLGLGRLAAGWDGYESRWAMHGRSGARDGGWPLWQGERLEGCRVLVWREQGVGDEILFATCLPDLVALGAEVTLLVDPRLVSLMRRGFPEIRVLADGALSNEHFDYQIPLGGLPRILRRTRADFRSRWSYLIPARQDVARWAERLRPLGESVRVGVCWRSGLAAGERTRYYAALEHWFRVFEIPGVSYVNLQYGECEAELGRIEAATGATIHRWADLDLKNDFDSVAALIWHLDLVITAPTAVSSLAGALGTETWQLDPGTDWTVFGEARSPWLPAVQLYRREAGERTWTSAFDAVVDALRRRAGGLAALSTSFGV
ncbi:MAG: tetratricopeptide repeat protein [Gemmatimonadales bacterium]